MGKELHILGQHMKDPRGAGETRLSLQLRRIMLQILTDSTLSTDRNVDVVLVQLRFQHLRKTAHCRENMKIIKTRINVDFSVRYSLPRLLCGSSSIVFLPR